MSAPPLTPRAPPQGDAPTELLAELERESGPLNLDVLAACMRRRHGADVVPVPAAGVDWGAGFAVNGRPITGALYVTDPRAHVPVRRRLVPRHGRRTACE